MGGGVGDAALNYFKFELLKRPSREGVYLRLLSRILAAKAKLLTAIRHRVSFPSTKHLVRL